MKLHRLTYLLFLVAIACLNVACDSEQPNSEHNVMALDTLQFSDNYKTVLINANFENTPPIGDPADTVKNQFRVIETDKLGDTLKYITPHIVKVRNIIREQVEKADLKLVALVDLTMDQTMVNAARESLLMLRSFFPEGSIYVSFMTDKTHLSPTVPFSTPFMEHDFISYANNATDKYLYRNLLRKLKECNNDTVVAGRNKLLLLLSDGQVWGNDRPLDPDHFTMQQQLLDYAEEYGSNVPLVYASMSSDESLAPETNTTMQIVAERTGGACSQGCNLDVIHRTICRIHHLKDVDLQFQLEYPDKRVFWGEPINLYIECLQGDSVVARGKRAYHTGTLYEPLVVNGESVRMFVMGGFLMVSIIALIAYFMLQIVVPYIKYRLFKRKYVAPYTGVGMSIGGRLVADTCYFCKAPFQPGDLIVGRCPHTMHKECWDENGYHCTEHGVHCPEGTHYYSSENLFDPKNGTYHIRWVLCAIAAAVVGWGIFYLIPSSTKTSLLLFLSSGILVDDLTGMALNYTYRMPAYGFYSAAVFVAAIAYLVRRRQPWYIQLRNILLRALIAGVGAYMCFFLDMLICTTLRIETGNEIIGALALALITMWVVVVASYHTGIRVNRRIVAIAYVVRVLGTIISANFYWGVVYDFRVTQLITLVVYNVILAIALAYDVQRSEHYFLRVEGAVKNMDIALYKWLRVSPAAVVTIGRSVDCNLQLSWDIESDVAPLQAEVVQYKGQPCLIAHESGVWRHDETPLHVGQRLRLYHGTKFRIGATTFTYIEKDK